MRDRPVSRSTVSSPTSSSEKGHVARALVIHSPGGAADGITRAVGGRGLVIGRSPEDDEAIELNDPEVSRHHARLVRDQSVYTLHDLGSRNGTFVNGRRVQTAGLANGDVVRIGSHILLFEIFGYEQIRALPLKRHAGEAMVGDSPALSGVRLAIQRAAQLSTPVLVLGESGVGKELVAAELHRSSGRRGAFVPVNCAAVTESLVERELFGHAKGAFTGASAASPGLFVQADRGTIFLDEIGEMSLDAQAKLLRVLATGEVRAVGASELRHVDVQVVAATNRDLRAAVDDGSFRHDLYARLLGTTVEVPPLRERRDDVLRLTRHFLDDASIEIPSDAAEALVLYDWEFNVRELQQLVSTVATEARERGRLELDLLPERIREPVASRAEVQERVVEVPIWMRIRREGKPTREEMHEVVSHYRGNVHHIADFFGRDRKQIYRWIEQMGIDIEASREEER